MAGLGSGKLDVPELIEHIVRDNAEPYFRLYFTGLETRSLNVDVKAVRSAEEPLNEGNLQDWDFIEVIGSGIVKIEGKEIKGGISIWDGKIKEVRHFYNAKTLRGDEAMAKMTEISWPVKVSMYTIDMESLMEAIMSHVAGGGGKLI